MNFFRFKQKKNETVNSNPLLNSTSNENNGRSIQDNYQSILDSVRDNLLRQVIVSGIITKIYEKTNESFKEISLSNEDLNLALKELQIAGSNISDSSLKVNSILEDAVNVFITLYNILNEQKASIQSSFQELEKIRESFSTLENSVKSITKVTTIIKEINTKTNLLSLNASIEAARAGDAGKGFSVVADEVGQLSQKTMSATKEISVWIQKLQESLNDLKGNNSNLEKSFSVVVEKNETVSGKASNSKEELYKAQDCMQEIAAALEQQNATFLNISHTSEDLRSHFLTSFQAIENLNYNLLKLSK